MRIDTEDIRDWFQAGKLHGATHMIIVNDNFINEQFVVFVMPDQQVKDVEKYCNSVYMQIVDKIYSMSKNIDIQLNIAHL
jgi:hypothetical protein